MPFVSSIDTSMSPVLNDGLGVLDVVDEAIEETEGGLTIPVERELWYEYGSSDSTESGELMNECEDVRVCGGGRVRV